MGNLFLSNGKDFDLSFLKSGLKINGDNEVLKKYDTNSNSIFEENELAQLKSDILDADKNNDNKIDRQEAIDLAGIIGIAQNKISELFSGDKNALDEAIEALMYEQAKDDSISILLNEANQAYEIFTKAQGGIVSESYNALKELLNDKQAKSKVLRQIAVKQTSGQILEISKTGISKTEYLKLKIDLLEALLGVDNLSEEEKRAIKNGIPKLTVRKLETLILKLSNAEDNEYDNTKNKIISELLVTGAEKPKDIGYSQSFSPDSIEAILKHSTAEDKLTFEQVYKLETGIDFSADKVNEYKKIERDTKYFVILNNRISGIDMSLKSLSEQTKLMENTNRHGEEQGTYNDIYKTLSGQILSTLNTYYGKDSEKILEIIKQYGFESVEIENGNIKLNNRIDGYALVELAKKVNEDISPKMENLKTQFTQISDRNYTAELNNAYISAFGPNKIDIARAFSEDQQSGVQAIEIGAGIVGVGVAVFSGGTVLTLSGLALATFGGPALEYAEATTKEGGITPEEKEAIIHETKIAIAMLPIGMGIGAASAKFGTMVAQKCPTLIAKFAEYGSDAIMSTLVDYAITGEVSITGEGVSELINILAGIVAHKRIQKHMHTIAPDAEVKPELSPVQSTKTAVVSPAQNGDGYIVKIGDEEFFAKDFDELDKILSQKTQKGDNIDFSAFELGEDICSGAREDEGFWTKIKNRFGYGKDEEGPKGPKTPGQLERKDIKQSTPWPKDVDTVMSRIKYVYDNYYFKENGWSYNDIVNKCFAGNVDINHKMFDSEKTLYKYICDCIRMMNTADSQGNLIYCKKYYNFNTKRISTDTLDTKLIQDIAMLKATSPELDSTISRLCKEYEGGILDQFSLKSMVKFLQEGYISPETIDVCLNTGIYRTIKSKHIKLSELADAEVSSNKKIISARKNTIDSIIKMYPELKPVIKQLKSEIGDDIYRIKWDLLDLSSLDSKGLNAFIGDIKNILHLNNTQLTSDNFFIRMKGFGSDQNWAHEMTAITEQAARMIDEGASSDEVLAFMAAETREQALSGRFNEDLALSQGILRCERDGYNGNAYFEEHGAITDFENPNSKYYPYAERFRQRYDEQYGGKPLHNPYEGQFELTRLDPNGHYPIEANEYDPSNPKHHKVTDANGNVEYYVETEAMIHPKGKYANNALNIVKNLQSDLISKYKGKALTEADLDVINETIGEIHWILSHSMPWGRGSAGIAQSYVLALYQSLGLKVYPPQKGISFDLEAFCTELSDYKKNYKYLYEKPAEIAK